MVLPNVEVARPPAGLRAARRPEPSHAGFESQKRFFARAVFRDDFLYGLILLLAELQKLLVAHPAVKGTGIRKPLLERFRLGGFRKDFFPIFDCFIRSPLFAHKEAAPLGKYEVHVGFRKCRDVGELLDALVFRERQRPDLARRELVIDLAQLAEDSVDILPRAAP